MASMTTKRSLDRYQTRRQRRRRLRRGWNWLLGDTVRGVRVAWGEFRVWLDQELRLP